MRKEDCPGCRALVDGLGRYRPGFCGPRCQLRLARDKWFADHGQRERLTGENTSPKKTKSVEKPKQEKKAGPVVECLVEGCRRGGLMDGRCLAHHERHLKYAGRAVP